MLDGLVTDVPLPDVTADVTVARRVDGIEPKRGAAELERITRPGATVVSSPACRDVDDAGHRILVDVVTRGRPSRSRARGSSESTGAVSVARDAAIADIGRVVGETTVAPWAATLGASVPWHRGRQAREAWDTRDATHG